MIATPSKAATRRQQVIDYLRSKPVGDVVTYGEIQKALGLADIAEVRWVVNGAIKAFERELSRTLQNERGMGYRIVVGVDQVNVSRGKQKRGIRALARASDTARAVDMTTVPHEQQGYVKAFQVGMHMLLQVAKVHTEKLADHEEQLQEIVRAQYRDRSRQRATEAEMAEVRRQVEEQRRKAEEQAEAIRNLEKKVRQ